MANPLASGPVSALSDDTFVFAAALADIPQSGLHGVEIGETSIVLVRTDDGVRALAGKCPHAGAPLAKGALCGKKLVCPWHMGGFDVENGAWLEPPALAGLLTFDVRMQGDDIFVDVQHPREPGIAEIDRSGIVGTGPIVFVGAGAVASAAINVLRTHDRNRAIIAIDPRDREPIDRTQLSKNALSGKVPPEKLPLFDDAKKDALDFEQIIDTVTHVDAKAKIVRTASGREIAFGDCVIATGGVAVQPKFPGAELPGVSVIRQLQDLEKIRPFIADAAHAVVLGTSFIAMEAASAMRDAGVEVTVIGRPELPFAKQFGEVAARAIQQLHEGRGVRFMLGEEVQALHGAGRVQKVSLASGKEIACDVVVVGYGVRPATEFLTEFAKNDDGGIIVAADLSIAPNVYVGGDIAVAPFASGTARIEHWRLAQQHGYSIGQQLAGKTAEKFDKAPFFWSQQHGKRLAYVGHAGTWDDVVIDGDIMEMDFLALYVREGHVRAALTCKRESATALLTELLTRDISVTDVLAAVK